MYVITDHLRCLNGLRARLRGVPVFLECKTFIGVVASCSMEHAPLVLRSHFRRILIIEK